MKKLFSIFFLISLASLMSCDSPASEEDTQDRAEDINKENFTGRSQQEAGFVVEAYSFNLMLIEYAKVIQQKENIPPRLAQYAENALRFHSEMNQTLENLAQEHQITLPREVGDNVIEYKEELLEKEGKELFEDYIEVVDKIQDNMITSYNAAAEGAMDNDIRRFAESILPGIRNRDKETDELEGYLEEL